MAKKKKKKKRQKSRNQRVPATRTIQEPTAPPAVLAFEFRGDYYQGPIPPPEALEYFERIVPGAATRLIGMAERQAAHRQDLESALIRGNVSSEKLGQIFGTVVFLAGLGFAGWAAYLGMPWLSLSSFLVDLASFSGLLVWGRRKGKAELAVKRGGERPVG